MCLSELSVKELIGEVELIEYELLGSVELEAKKLLFLLDSIKLALLELTSTNSSSVEPAPTELAPLELSTTGLEALEAESPKLPIPLEVIHFANPYAYFIGLNSA